LAEADGLAEPSQPNGEPPPNDDPKAGKQQQRRGKKRQATRRSFQRIIQAGLREITLNKSELSRNQASD
jgi:hypothetical protein